MFVLLSCLFVILSRFFLWIFLYYSVKVCDRVLLYVCLPAIDTVVTFHVFLLSIFLTHVKF